MVRKESADGSTLTIKGSSMFDHPRYIASSFTVTFPRQTKIRQQALAIEKHLEGRYNPPLMLPVPDEFDPSAPRMIFASQSGYSQLIITQVSTILNTTYSPQWQIGTQNSEPYANQHVGYVFGLLSALKINRPSICGFTVHVRLSTEEDNRALLEFLINRFLKDTDNEGIHDVEVRKTRVIRDTFFSNVVTHNYRLWNQAEPLQGTLKLSDEDVVERGVEVVVDVNDRYAFNERASYRTTLDTARQVLAVGFSETQLATNLVTGGTQ